MKLGSVINKGSWNAVRKQALERSHAIQLSLLLAENAAKRQSLTYTRLRRYAGQRPDGHLIRPLRGRALPVPDLDLRMKYWRLRRQFEGPIPVEFLLGEEVK